MLKFGNADQTPNLRLQGQGIDRHPILGMVDESEWPVYVKTGTVIAVPAPRAGTIVTLEGEMAFHGDDYVVTDNPPTHAWPVRKDVFERTYRRATEDDAIRSDDDLDSAWGLIANAGGGDWTRETPEWQEAAARWRDGYSGHARHVAPILVSEAQMDDVVIDEAGSEIPGARIRRTVSTWKIGPDGEREGEPEVETFVLGEETPAPAIEL